MPLSTIAGRNNTLIRKALDAVVFVAPDTASAITTLTTATNEVQTITITGTPTGGTFTLTYAGQTTSGIAYNAAAGAVQSALEALNNLAPGDVVVTGGPGPGTPWVATFGGTLAVQDVALMTAGSAGLTGGTTPTASVATTTPGNYDLAALPSGYSSLGWHTKEQGLSWPVNTETSDVTSHGASEPTRRDIISEVTGLEMTAQESKLKTFELYNNVDLSTVVPTATTGEIAWNKATQPATRYYRLLSVAQDGAGTGIYYIARFCPRATITGRGAQTWSDGSEIGYPLTWTATVDPVLGYSVREIWAGPGLRSALTAMGFPAAS